MTIGERFLLPWSMNDTFRFTKLAAILVREQEKFLKDRESSLVLVQSPWKAALETGRPDAAFDDNRLKQQVYTRARNIRMRTYTDL